MAKKAHKKKTKSGAGYIAWLGVAICCMLAFNAWMVEAFVDANEAQEWDKRLIQSIQFTCPVILVFVEFWIFDILVAALREE